MNLLARVILLETRIEKMERDYPKLSAMTKELMVTVKESKTTIDIAMGRIVDLGNSVEEVFRLIYEVHKLMQEEP